MNSVFFGGAITGALFIAGVLAICINFWRRPRRKKPEPQFQEASPVVTTRLLIQERNFEF